jgi:membrane carboxypeptidase/penicillin-binding protein PbpC
LKRALLSLLAAVPLVAAALPGFEAVRAAHGPSDIPLLARDGSVLQLVRTDARSRRGAWVALAEVSPALRHALVLGEDRRFWDHAGVDWRSLAAGAWARAWDGRTRGASTITMQLAALLQADLARPAGGRGVGDKLAQIGAARELDSRWSKSQILEAYLNRVPLRGELVGVAAAAQQLFGKHASGLDSVEAALLAALVRAPNAPAATLQRRACELLQQQALGCEGLATRTEQALALQQRLITPASLLDDAPLQLQAAGALYQPQNYDQGFRGPVSVRVALGSSLNVPAVQVGAMLGPEALFDGLQRAGLKLSHSAGFHGHALALGSADVSLFDLAQAYRVLAQGGVRGSEQGGTWVFEPAVAWLVSHMLADPAARAETFGFDSALVTRGWAAVKTGTSKDMRDNWCIGYSQRHTVAVWVGNAGGAPMHGVSGVSGAAPVWRELMALLQAGAPAQEPPRPAGLVARGGEWFLAGTEPRTGAAAAPSPFPAFGIRSPRDGSIVALDPEIPMAAQRLVFEGAAGRWSVGGRPVGQGTRVSWLPRPGRHVIELHTAGGRERVEIEVRAAPLRRKSG